MFYRIPKLVLDLRAIMRMNRLKKVIKGRCTRVRGNAEEAVRFPQTTMWSGISVKPPTPYLTNLLELGKPRLQFSDMNFRFSKGLG